MRDYETVWTFNTARFTVALEIEPEDLMPEDSFDDQETIDDIRNGSIEWFQAIVSVYCDGNRVASDHLGGCAYRTVREFYTSHRDSDPMNRNCSVRQQHYVVCHYFPEMVRTAVREARKNICSMPRLRVKDETQA